MSDHKEYCSTMLTNEEIDEILEDPGKESDELLIDAVRAYPHLYNHQDRNFKDNLMKENSWKEISLAVNLPVSECQTRWTRLRERFGKEKRQREQDSKSGSGATRRALFAFYENMLFLNDHIKRRKSHTNFSTAKISKKDDSQSKCSQTQNPKPGTIQQQHNNRNVPIHVQNSTECNGGSISSCANFLPSFQNRFLTPAVQKPPARDDESASTSDSSRDNAIVNLAEQFDETSRSSTTSSSRQATPCPAAPITSATPLSRRPMKLKKKESADIEGSFVSLCEVIKSQVTNSPNEDFSKMVRNLLDRLAPDEQMKRQQEILAILYRS